jgi:hypothetical protein
MLEMGNVNTILFGEPGRNTTTRQLTRRLKDIIKMDLKEIGLEI